MANEHDHVRNHDNDLPLGPGLEPQSIHRYGLHPPDSAVPLSASPPAERDLRAQLLDHGRARAQGIRELTDGPGELDDHLELTGLTDALLEQLAGIAATSANTADAIHYAVLAWLDLHSHADADGPASAMRLLQKRAGISALLAGMRSLAVLTA